MSFGYYPVVYTRTAGLDFRFWAEPKSFDEDLPLRIRQIINVDHYSCMTLPRHFYIRTERYILWGVAGLNRLFLPKDYQNDTVGRPIRGCWGGLVDLTESGVPDLATLPLDFEAGMPFAAMLHDTYVASHWNERLCTPSMEKVTHSEQAADHPISSVEIERPENQFQLIRQTENVEKWFRSIVMSGVPTSAVTGIEEMRHAEDLGRQWQFQHIAVANLPKECEWRTITPPKPKRTPQTEIPPAPPVEEERDYRSSFKRNSKKHSIDTGEAEIRKRPASSKTASHNVPREKKQTKSFSCGDDGQKTIQENDLCRQKNSAGPCCSGCLLLKFICELFGLSQLFDSNKSEKFEPCDIPESENPKTKAPKKPYNPFEGIHGEGTDKNDW